MRETLAEFEARQDAEYRARCLARAARADARGEHDYAETLRERAEQGLEGLRSRSVARRNARAIAAQRKAFGL